MTNYRFTKDAPAPKSPDIEMTIRLSKKKKDRQALLARIRKQRARVRK